MHAAGCAPLPGAASDREIKSRFRADCEPSMRELLAPLSRGMEMPGTRRTASPLLANLRAVAGGKSNLDTSYRADGVGTRGQILGVRSARVTLSRLELVHVEVL